MRIELLPHSMAERLSVQSRETFLTEIGDAPLLLVPVDSPDDDLATGLVEVAATRGTMLRSSPALSYQTFVGANPNAPTRPARRPRPKLFGPAYVAALLSGGPLVVVPLRKRSDVAKPFEERISVGRARNNDVVLRHATVSKFHAWFECDDDDEYYLNDARSTNPTRVNTTVVSSEPVQVHPGDEVSFGDISALFCPAGTLWDALRGEAAGNR
jgi:hypothetical protein